MNKFFNKFLNILLIMLICFLALNQYYIVKFSDDLRNVFAFLTISIIFLTSVKEIVSKKNGFTKFMSIVILFTTIVGGVLSIITKEINFLIYICILASLFQGFFQLIYNT